ncbi:MAG: cation diffusion facilitator family transporter [Candidatus Natronoplasma sp.]
MVEENPQGKLVAIVSIILNIGIFIAKLYIGFLIGSLALLSDAFHSISDSASSVAVYIGLAVSEKPADEEHPHGHGRADQIAVLVVGIILLLTALTFLSEGFQSLIIEPQILEMRDRFYFYIFLTAVAKEIIGEVSYFVGKKTDSDPLKADAWHHRGDAITTMLVIGAIYGSEAGLLFLDSLAGIGIALLLGYIGISYIKKSTNRLLGTKPSSQIIDEIKKTASDIEGVKEVHDIKVHDYGKDKAISLHMISNEGTIRSAHKVSHKLEEKLEERFGSTAEVHLDPISIPRGHIEDLIQENVDNYEQVLEAHRIKITESEEKILISLHLVLPDTVSIKDAHDIATKFERDIEMKSDGEIKADIEIQAHVEPEDECLSETSR